MASKTQQLKDAMKKTVSKPLSQEDQDDLKSTFVSPKRAKKTQTIVRLYDDELQT